MKSQNGARPKLAMAGCLSASVVLIVLGLVSQPTHVLARAVSNSAGLNQSYQRSPNAGNGIIVGVVVNERQEPVARAQVQAFSVRTTFLQVQQGQTVPFSTRASGSASTDTEGRFQISGLELGDYLVAAEAVPSLTSGASRQTPIYATTFYPSTIDYQVAVRVSALAYGATPIQIELVEVKGARVAGSVVSHSGRPASGMDGRLFHRFELTEGNHEVVVFVAPREAPAPTVDGTLSVAALVEQFKSEKVFWRQFTIAKEIVDRHNLSALPSLVTLLNQEDRHLRGNAAFVFGGLGDPRGLQVITEILSDRSDRREGQGVPSASSDGRYHVERQVAADRYYAAHLLGDLRDPRAVPILVPLLKDKDVNSIVPWALGQIGDKRAVGPLLDALDDDSPSMRVLSIYALEILNAREALPRLISLLDDHRKSNFGALVSVAEAAKAAIAKLQ